jgi:amino acid permease
MSLRRVRSLDQFNPPFSSHTRQGSVYGGVMNLVGTIIGGGTLSLPWAFRQSGVLIGLIVLGLSAISCDVSIYFLLSAARRSGGMRTYDEVVDAAFGRPGKLMALWSVVLTCFFSIVAYGVLLRGLISPLLARYVIGHSLSDGSPSSLGVPLCS